MAPFRSRPDDSTEFEKRLVELTARVESLAGKLPDVVMRWAMGELMPSFLGRLEPARVEARLLETLHETVSRNEK
jgi:hypothetical protein